MNMAIRQTGETKGSQLINDAQDALNLLDGLSSSVNRSVLQTVMENSKLSPELMERNQHLVHGFAWLATYVEAIRQMVSFGKRLKEENKLGEIEILLTSILIGEYLTQILGGIPMSQGHYIRLSEFGLAEDELKKFSESALIANLIATGNTPGNRTALANLLQYSLGAVTYGSTGLDETNEQFRDEMFKFAENHVKPHAHEWHLSNSYIPMSVIEKVAELGVFGLTIPEEFGGLEMGKVSMCVVSEELSRAYIGVGSLGTRSEIAGELILCGGTDEQKQKWLPKISSGEILPTAVFTEPNTGSDLASLKCRAQLEGDHYSVFGNKTWITHPARADLMTLLVRTNPDEPGYKGISMLLAEKPRGTDENPFPADGMSGSEIVPIGYRGMKEFEIAFDGFLVKKENLLGGVEGQGFKQLMQTFESARIQTAARAIGVAQSALDLGLQYAQDRVQFGKALINFPRVSDKLALMAAEIAAIRQLTYFAAREKDSGRRCDVEAGMAKLLGARVAWAAADNSLQIHGGNGYAQEFEISRVLCDARLLNIFEGTSEIQAQVIARRLLEDHN